MIKRPEPEADNSHIPQRLRMLGGCRVAYNTRKFNTATLKKSVGLKERVKKIVGLKGRVLCVLHVNEMYFKTLLIYFSRSQWPRGLRRRSTAARLLHSWVRIPPRAWMSVCYECCVLSGRGLCDGLIIRSEESYRLWRLVVCDHETSQARRLKPARGV